MDKSYLGDNVYAEIDADGVITLTTENGLGPSNVIVLEPEVYRALVSYVDRSRSSRKRVTAWEHRGVLGVSPTSCIASVWASEAKLKVSPYTVESTKLNF